MMMDSLLTVCLAAGIHSDRRYFSEIATGNVQANTTREDDAAEPVITGRSSLIWAMRLAKVGQATGDLRDRRNGAVEEVAARGGVKYLAGSEC